MAIVPVQNGDTICSHAVENLHLRLSDLVLITEVRAMHGFDGGDHGYIRLRHQ